MPRGVGKELREYDDAYLECRALRRHAMFRVPNREPRGRRVFAGPNSYRITLRCEKCGTELELVIAAHTGKQVSVKYDYPRGYKIDTSKDRMPAKLRAEYVRRLMASESNVVRIETKRAG